MVKLSFLPVVLSYSTKLSSGCLALSGSQYLILITVPKNMFLTSLKSAVLYSSVLWATSEASGAFFLIILSFSFDSCHHFVYFRYFLNCSFEQIICKNLHFPEFSIRFQVLGFHLILSSLCNMSVGDLFHKYYFS